jgi:thiamine pyrophosphate-dependent acetolactate synthase large subunit-like protein
MANSTENGWPLLALGGGNPTYLHATGGFQEMDQVAGTKRYVK